MKTTKKTPKPKTPKKERRMLNRRKRPLGVTIELNNYEWLHSRALQIDRPISWIVNKLITKAKEENLKL